MAINITDTLTKAAQGTDKAASSSRSLSRSLTDVQRTADAASRPLTILIKTAGDLTGALVKADTAIEKLTKRAGAQIATTRNQIKGMRVLGQEATASQMKAASTPASVIRMVVTKARVLGRAAALAVNEGISKVATTAPIQKESVVARAATPAPIDFGGPVAQKPVRVLSQEAVATQIKSATPIAFGERVKKTAEAARAAFKKDLVPAKLRTGFSALAKSGGMAGSALSGVAGWVGRLGGPVGMALLAAKTILVKSAMDAYARSMKSAAEASKLVAQQNVITASTFTTVAGVELKDMEATTAALREKRDQWSELQGRVRDANVAFRHDADEVSASLARVVHATGTKIGAITEASIADMQAIVTVTGKSYEEIGDMVAGIMNAQGKTYTQAVSDIQMITSIAEHSAALTQQTYRATELEKISTLKDGTEAQRAEYDKQVADIDSRSKEISGIFKTDMFETVKKLAEETGGFLSDFKALASAVGASMDVAQGKLKLSYDVALKFAEIQTKILTGKDMPEGYAIVDLPRKLATLEGMVKAGKLSGDQLQFVRAAQEAMKQGDVVGALKNVQDSGLTTTKEMMAENAEFLLREAARAGKGQSIMLRTMTGDIEKSGLNVQYMMDLQARMQELGITDQDERTAFIKKDLDEHGKAMVESALATERAARASQQATALSGAFQSAWWRMFGPVVDSLTKVMNGIMDFVDDMNTFLGRGEGASEAGVRAGKSVLSTADWALTGGLFTGGHTGKAAEKLFSPAAEKAAPEITIQEKSASVGSATVTPAAGDMSMAFEPVGLNGAGELEMRAVIKNYAGSVQAVNQQDIKNKR